MQKGRVADHRRDGTVATRTGYTCSELAADLVMYAGSGVSNDNAIGPEDSIVTEMIQELPTEILHVMLLGRSFS